MVKLGGYRKVWLPYNLKAGPRTDDVEAVIDPDRWGENPVSSEHNSEVNSE